MCAQKCPLNVQIAFKYTKIYWSSSIYQIVNAILVGFPQAKLLDPLEIYYSSHPDTPWKFAPLDPPPPLELPVTFHGGMDIFWNYFN